MILFLDFDGVLHPFFPRADRSDEENQLFAYLPRLEGVLRDFPEWQIVISSSWREHHPWTTVIKAFSISPRLLLSFFSELETYDDRFAKTQILGAVQIINRFDVRLVLPGDVVFKLNAYSKNGEVALEFFPC